HAAATITDVSPQPHQTSRSVGAVRRCEIRKSNNQTRNEASRTRDAAVAIRGQRSPRPQPSDTMAVRWASTARPGVAGGAPPQIGRNLPLARARMPSPLIVSAKTGWPRLASVEVRSACGALMPEIMIRVRPRTTGEGRCARSAIRAVRLLDPALPEPLRSAGGEADREQVLGEDRVEERALPPGAQLLDGLATAETEAAEDQAGHQSRAVEAHATVRQDAVAAPDELRAQVGDRLQLGQARQVLV